MASCQFLEFQGIGQECFGVTLSCCRGSPAVKEGSERYGVHALPSVQGAAANRPGGGGGPKSWAGERPCRAFGVRVSGGVNPPGAEVTGRSAAW